VILGILWGFSFPAISVGLRSLEPILFAAFRYDIAAVLLIFLAIVRTNGWRPEASNDVVAILGGGVFLIGANVFLFLGQQTVASGVAAVIQSLVPIATTLWAAILLPSERIQPIGLVGIFLGFIGVGLVVSPDPANLLGGDTFGKGLILIQVIGISLGGVIVQRANSSLDNAALAGWSMAVGGILLHCISVITNEPFALPAAPLAWVAVIYLGVFATALAFFLYYTLLGLRGALETSLVSYVVPVVATVAGVVLLNESIGPLTLVGFGIVFVGFVLLKRRAMADLVTDIYNG
jgi:drug/metabolite transporter (DMT)-like permease